jgi:hypothetical protein
VCRGKLRVGLLHFAVKQAIGFLPERDRHLPYIQCQTDHFAKRQVSFFPESLQRHSRSERGVASEGHLLRWQEDPDANTLLIFHAGLTRNDEGCLLLVYLPGDRLHLLIA